MTLRAEIELLKKERKDNFKGELITNMRPYSFCRCDKTVLIASDPFSLIALEVMLGQQFNLNCERASNGKEAVKKFSKDQNKTCCAVHIKVVIMDVNMQEMNGFSAS